MFAGIVGESRCGVDGIGYLHAGNAVDMAEGGIGCLYAEDMVEGGIGGFFSL
jgi:hypothetical protein